VVLTPCLNLSTHIMGKNIVPALGWVLTWRTCILIVLLKTIQGKEKIERKKEREHVQMITPPTWRVQVNSWSLSFFLSWLAVKTQLTMITELSRWWATDQPRGTQFNHLRCRADPLWAKIVHHVCGLACRVILGLTSPNNQVFLTMEKQSAQGMVSPYYGRKGTKSSKHWTSRMLKRDTLVATHCCHFCFCAAADWPEKIQWLRM